jgi:hypothetical protein
MLPPIERGRELAANYVGLLSLIVKRKPIAYLVEHILQYNFLAFQFVPLSAKDFYEDYLPAAYTPNDTSPTKLGAVFTIFSLGTLFDPNMPSTFNEDAQRYFLRGQNVLAAAKALSQNTLATSQSIQLCGSFLLCQHNLKEGGETFFPLVSPSNCCGLFSGTELPLILTDIVGNRESITRHSSTTSRWYGVWDTRRGAQPSSKDLLGIHYD